MRFVLPDLGPGLDRTMDATALNAVANHPDVRPWLGGDGPLDLTGMLADPANVAGLSAHGGFLAVAHGAGRYEVHSLFQPTRSAGETTRAMRAAVTYMFAATDAVELVTKVPDANLAAAGLARLAGFQLLFTMAAPWTADTRVPMHFNNLTLDRWALASPDARTLGTWLHDAMDAAKEAAGSTLGPHSADDDTHDRMAGAAILMVRAGHPVKAVEFYNRWATFAGYPAIRLLRKHPIVIDLEGIIVEARPTEMEILQCQ